MSTQIRALALTPETLTDLERLYKATRDRRVAERILCVIWKAQQRTHQEISDLLFISTNTVSEWLQSYVADGIEALCQIEAGGSVSQLTAAQLAELQTELDRRLFSTAAEVADWVSHHFGVTYSERGMQALLQRLEFSFQKTRLVPSRANEQAQEDFLKDIHST
jgi:transposase